MSRSRSPHEGGERSVQVVLPDHGAFDFAEAVLKACAELNCLRPLAVQGTHSMLLMALPEPPSPDETRH